jgi:hypothetical protein
MMGGSGVGSTLCPPQAGPTGTPAGPGGERTEGVRKKTNGRNINLDQLNLPILLDEFPMKAMGLPARLKWI